MTVGRFTSPARTAALVAGVLAATAIPGAARAGTHLPVTRVIGSTPGRAVPASFAGLSIEYSSAQDYFGTPSQPNARFIRLLRTLAASGAGAPSVRLGGDSSDESWWNPSSQPPPVGVQTDLSPGWISALRPAAEQAHVPFILGLNLALDDPLNALAYTQAAIAGLPSGSVRSLEIGNQPDLYGRSVTFRIHGHAVTRIQRRPADWSFAAYEADLDPYVTALDQARQDGWPDLSVGAFAQSSWEAAEGDLLQHEGGNVQEFDTHWHPLHTCPPRRHATPASLLHRLVAPAAVRAVIKRFRRVVEVADATDTLVRVTEVNSATCGGLSGLSDTMGAALWTTDLLFSLARLGVEGVNVHTFTGAAYAPVEFPLRNGQRTGVAHPLLYGMLLFDRAAPAGAKLLPVSPDSDRPVKTWATIDLTGTIRAVVLNENFSTARVARLKLPGHRRAGTVQRLLSRSIASRSGVTLGGQSFETGGFDGRLHGQGVRETTRPVNAVYTLTVPAASAALITVRR